MENPGDSSSSQTTIVGAKSPPKLFVVIEFLRCKTIDFAPTSWLNEDTSCCYFPTKTYKGFRTLQEKAGSEPEEDWPDWGVRVIKGYDSCEKASAKVTKLVKVKGPILQEHIDTTDKEKSSTRGRKKGQSSSRRRGSSSVDILAPAAPPVGSVFDKGQPPPPYPRAEDEPLPPPQTGEEDEENTFPPASTPNTPRSSTSSFRTIFLNGNFPRGEQNRDDITVEETLTEEISLSRLFYEFRAFQVSCLTKQETLTAHVKNLEELLRKVLVRYNQASRSSLFKLKSLEELKKAEDKLNSDRTYYTDELLLLKELVGRDFNRTVYGILDHIFHHELAQLVRWTDSTGKESLQKYVGVVQLIIDAVRRIYQEASLRVDKSKQIEALPPTPPPPAGVGKNPPLVSYVPTEDAIRTSISAWFRASRDRKGGRIKQNRNGDEIVDEETENTTNGEQVSAANPGSSSTTTTESPAGTTPSSDGAQPN